MTRVLIIDDDRSVGAAIQMTLAGQGYDSLLALDPQTGVRAFATSAFDMALVDIFMPGMNGIEVIKTFRQRAPAVPIIAMSGFKFRGSMGAGLDLLAMASKLGAASCLRKPFSPQQLMAAINAGLVAEFSGDDSVADRKPRQGSEP